MKLIFVVMLLALAGCDNRPLDQRERSSYKLEQIPELRDCTYIKIDDIKIIRCPNSSTGVTYTVPQGKGRKTVNTVTVDGEQ